MKKILPFLCALFLASNLLAQAPPCVRDSVILGTDSLLWPLPYTDLLPNYNLRVACVGEAYNQSVTINVPDNFQGIPLINVSLATSGAISNLPVGLTYACDPPNCVFNPKTLGCIILYGTPTSANAAPSQFDLGITATVATPLGSLPIQFPGQLAPGSHYYLQLKPMGECSTATYDAGNQLSKLTNAPNPFGRETFITAEALVSGTFQFEVFNLMGKRVHQQTLRLEAGRNEFTFEAGSLPEGTYFYSLGNREGKATRRMVIAK